MNRDAVLAAVAALVALLAVGGAVAVPGAVSGPDRYTPPGRLNLAEVTVTPDGAAGANATLAVTTYLRHAGGPTDNVTVRYRAIDTDTGFVAARDAETLGTVTGDREANSTGRLTVERQGGYRLETLVYVNGSRVEAGAKTVEGLGSLTPSYARTPVEFHRFQGADLPAVSFAVQDTANNRTTLNVSAYLTNTGGNAGDVRVTFVARQADSNIVADRGSVRVGRIDPGHTVAPSTTLTVPSGYNYYLDAVLWKDGVVVGSTRTTANLDPTETISANETRKHVGLKVSDFETTSASGSGGAPNTRTTTQSSTPGFTPVIAVVAVLGAVLATRRWSA